MSELLKTLVETARAEPARGWLQTKDASGAFERRSWAQVHEDARHTAFGLRARGVRAGDRVALFMGNPLDVAVCAQAAWLVGASITMLHQPTARTNLTTYAEDTFGILSMVRAKALVLGAPYADFAEHFSESAERAGTVVLSTSELSAGDELAEVDVDVSGDDSLALLQLTSGSTASPKAVRISHGALISNMRAMAAVSDIQDDDVMVSWLPVFHDMGMVGFLTVPMTFGFRLVKVTPADFVASPTGWMRLISDHRGTITAAPNFAYGIAARALSRARDLDLSSLRIALNGAEPVNARTVELFCAAGEPHGLSPRAVLCAYGMAEASLAVSFAPVGGGLVVDRIDQKVLSETGRAEPSDDPATGSQFAQLGPPLPGIEVEIRDAAGDRLGERRAGRIYIRGDAVTDGYETDDGYLPAKDAGGWLDTGDEGYLVNDEVVVCGRVKDLIILAGRNIYPTDIERAAERVAGVRRGNAAAVPIQTGGRESFAIVAESTYYDDPEHVRRIEQEVRLATYADLEVRPSRVILISPGGLPKTPSGKIQRAKVRGYVQQAMGQGDAAQ